MNYFQVSTFMNIDQAYIFKNCSVLLSVPVEYGDLLSVINKIKQVLLLMLTTALQFNFIQANHFVIDYFLFIRQK